MSWLCTPYPARYLCCPMGDWWHCFCRGWQSGGVPMARWSDYAALHQLCLQQLSRLLTKRVFLPIRHGSFFAPPLPEWSRDSSWDWRATKPSRDLRSGCLSQPNALRVRSVLYVCTPVQSDNYCHAPHYADFLLRCPPLTSVPPSVR